MANIVRGFQQPNLTNPVQTWQPGAAAFLGTQTLSNWGMSNANGFGFRTAKSIGAANITLSGGAVVYNTAVTQTLPNYQTTDNDTISNISTTAVYNPVFIGHDSDDYTIGLTISYGLGLPPNNEKCFKILPFGYKQTPTGTKNERTTWNYYDYPIGTTYNPGYGYISVENNPTWQDYPLVKMYRTTLFETEYYCFAFGVNAANQPAILSGQYVGAVFYIAPCAWFEDRIPVPYVGPVSKESVEASFSPPSTQYRDDISSRSGYNVNPYGVNSGSGIKLIFPNRLQDQSVYAGNLQQIINGIYRGSAQGFINMASQYIAEVTGGNTSRPQDEVSVILNGILSCHSIPHIFPAGSSASYALNATQFQTVCGYDVLLNQIDVTSPGQKTIFDQVYTSDKIEPRLNCFLDFEPYTHITLKLPFFPAISLQPSMIYDNFIKVTYKIDVLTGILSADVSVLYYGEEIIISTMQQNVKTAIPIMGAGATDSALNKIASSTIAVLSSFGGAAGGSSEGDMSSGFTMNIPQAAGAIYTGMDAISKAGTGVPVGKMSVDGLGVYLSPRSAYLIISHPEAAIPQAPDGTPSFLNNIGMAAGLGGKVSDFVGGYASFSAVDLSGFSATDTEKAAIRSLLMEGVYL